jgi:hypothetical protein
MTIQVEVSPEVEARLAAQAEARGMAIEAYAGKLLAESVPMYAAGTGVLTPEIVERMTQELTRGSEHLPVLPPEANDRESYYEDRW